jgi:hypothetical protein
MKIKSVRENVLRRIFGRRERRKLLDEGPQN